MTQVASSTMKADVDAAARVLYELRHLPDDECPTSRGKTPTSPGGVTMSSL